MNGTTTSSHAWLNFNNAAEQRNPDARRAETATLRQGLLARIEAVLHYLLPQGRIRAGKFYVGDIDGNPGKSLVVELDGQHAGLWKDFATGEGGDLFDLWARVRGYSAKMEFPTIAAEVQQWLGIHPASTTPQRDLRRPAIDELGPHTAKWNYTSANGELIACVYRYDPPTGKEFRPWDVRARAYRAPDPRPLYNLPAVIKASTVLLAEGEKCAQVLIDEGICATTAMNGAKAPVDKTDWSPLRGKHVLNWPDKDLPGWEYAEAAAQAIASAGALSVMILLPPESKPEKWDAADAVTEGFDCKAFIADGPRATIKAAPATLPVFSLGAMLDDDSPIPPDIVSPRVLTPAGMLVFGGAPKVGKSDFLLSWLAHMAAGAAFLGMRPARPLRVFYLQAEVQYHYLRERMRDIRLPASRMLDARRNLVATSQLRLVLDDHGLQQIIPAIAGAFDGEKPDIIAIDPIRNVFDGGEDAGKGGGENDNNAMLYFLSQRVERLRDAVNPEAGIVLAHHTKKLSKRQFEEDPFQALAGAGSLRGYYTTGMLLFRPDESRTTRQLIYELRNGPGIPTKYVDKSGGIWRELDPHSERLVKQDYGDKLDAERRRKHDVILQMLFDEAQRGRAYTVTQFAESFENQAGLGGRSTVAERIGVLATKGYVKFFQNPRDYGLPMPTRSKFGYLCVEDMALLRPKGDPDPETGELLQALVPVLPTHYKCRQSGAVLPVENPDVWIYQDEEEDHEDDHSYV
ncbi:MAG TPA: AAA family ATPase [Noviherbaspirillum sp.]